MLLEQCKGKPFCLGHPGSNDYPFIHVLFTWCGKKTLYSRNEQADVNFHFYSSSPSLTSSAQRIFLPREIRGGVRIASGINCAQNFGLRGLTASQFSSCELVFHFLPSQMEECCPSVLPGREGLGGTRLGLSSCSNACQHSGNRFCSPHWKDILCSHVPFSPNMWHV